MQLPRSLGEMLVLEGLITPEQLASAERRRAREGGFIGEILVHDGALMHDQLVSFLVKRCKIPHLSLLDYEVSEDLFKLVPKEVCAQYFVLPIDKLGKILTLAMVDPMDLEALERIREMSPDLRIKPILCDWTHFRQVSRRLFDAKGDKKAGAVDANTFGLSPMKAATTPTPAPAAPAARPASAAPDAAPTPRVDAFGGGPSRDWFETLSAGMGEAFREALKSVAHELRSPAAAPPLGDAQELSALMRESVRAGMAEAMVEAQLRGDESAMQAVRTVATAQHSGADRLEMAQRERLDRFRTVRAFGQPDKQGHNRLESLEAVASPGDAAVRDALDSDKPLSAYLFDTFVVGRDNVLTVDMAKRIAEAPGAAFNPFFVHGPVGIGKTHLINAIGNQVRRHQPECRVGYVSAGRFARRLYEAMDARAAEAFREGYCHWDVLILDDIQFLGGKVEAQEEFFHIFNALHLEGRQIVIAADKAPHQLGQLEQRLISRFEGGIVAHLAAPDYEARMAILRHHAAEAHAQAGDEVLALIATHVSSDVRKMTGVLRKIIAFAGLVGQDIDCELAYETLSHMGLAEPAV